MKDVFCEYLEYSDKEKKKLWKEATFVFDTNVILNLYRHSEKTRETLFSAFKNLNSQIWMPYHVAEEFMIRRNNVIFESIRKYEELEVISNKFVEECRKKLGWDSDDKELKELDKIIKTWTKKVKKENLIIEHPNNDKILDKLFTIFDKKVGKKFDDKTLSELTKEGKERYDKKIPPGYKDAEKDNGNELGDFFIWEELLDFSKKENKSIVFITNDQKEDWWNSACGKTIGPRIELRKEFNNKCNNKFHMYNMKQFINLYNEESKNIDEDVIKEISHFEKMNDKYEKNIFNYKKELFNLYKMNNKDSALTSNERLHENKYSINDNSDILDKLEIYNTLENNNSFESIINNQELYETFLEKFINLNNKELSKSEIENYLIYKKKKLKTEDID